MDDKSSNNSMLYLLVGALLVAVVVVGYIAMNNDGQTVVSSNTGTSAPAEDSGSKLKIDVDKSGSISGSIEQKSDN